jgi:hypothetical protein
MAKYNPENERVKRDYVAHMRPAQGKQESSTAAALAAIDRFENSTGYRSFKAFHIEQAKAFREKILTVPGARAQETLSAATMTSTLRNRRAFFSWLAERPGYRSRIRFSDAEYFNPTVAHARIAGARREPRVPTIDQFETVVVKMKSETLLECRDRDDFDSPAMTANPQADIGDVYAWTAPDGRRLNLVMTIVGHSFSDRLSYEFHVDSGKVFGRTTASMDDCLPLSGA